MAAARGPGRCLYEILGIELTAPADEIRAAYRKLALKLHPDKTVLSGVSMEEATARFQEILGAYEVLSDARERSLYDSHRSQILHPSAFSSSTKKSANYSAKRNSASSSSTKKPASSSSTKYCDFDINLSPFFHTSVYSGYGDIGKGFFKVYGDLFQRLSQQEIAYAQSMGAAPVPEAPLIGNLKSSYAQVCAFYNYWQGFSTVKDFTWLGENSVSAWRNRKTRGFTWVGENSVSAWWNRKRKKAKEEYNETVRQLAQFVKKRDKRDLGEEL